MRDISERKAYIEALEHQALHDGLTGLANRVLFGAHLTRALAAARRTNQRRAVLVMDVDGFKQVNDTHGHDRGDKLLKHLGARLVATLREGDTVARLGGDEFSELLHRADLAMYVAKRSGDGYAVFEASHER